MYNFQNLSPGTQEKQLSSVAMTYNGKVFENEIEGYNTLTVEGRELIGSSLSFYGDIPGRDGLWIKEETLPAREIVVKYQIEAEDNASYREAFNVLNALLRADKKDVVITFKDEPNWHFRGRLHSVEEPDTSTNTAIGSFILLCQDPYKYHTIETVTGTKPKITLGAKYPLEIENIKATLPSNVSKIILKNETTGRRVILNGSYSSGQILEIKKDSITMNNQNIIQDLDYTESDWHQFLINEGDTLSLTPSTSLALSVRRKLL